MKKTKTDYSIPAEPPVPAPAPAATAPAPRKRAVKKAAVPREETPILPPVEAAVEAPAPSIRVPAKKAVAKKAAAVKTPARRRAAEPVPVAEAPVLVLEVQEPAPPAAKRAAKKDGPAKKTARTGPAAAAAQDAAPEPVAATAVAASLPQPAAVAEPAPPVREADAAPAKKISRPRGAKSWQSKAPAAPESSPSPDATPSSPDHGDHAAAASNTPDVSTGASVNGGPAEFSGPPQDSRRMPSHYPAPRRDDGDGGPRGPLPPGSGPDGGDGRRLTKWERWKLRKEKFKQQKQQRYLERTGRPLQGQGPGPGPGGPGTPGPNGQGSPPPQGPGPSPGSGAGAGAGASGEQTPGYGQPHPQQGQGGDQRPPREGRTWEPRPPRPEPVMGPPEDCEGLLELTDNKGFGFLRPRTRGYAASPQDPFVSAELVRQLGLRDGVYIDGVMRRGGRGPMVQEVKTVNGLEPAAYRILPLFEELTAVNPNKRYILETDATRNTTRLIDFIAPIGRGQRGLIVAPPRAGKTTFLQHIAEAMLQKYPDVKVIVLLVDERPEEVTELTRALPGAEIMASSNDQDPRNHIRMASLAVERAKRLVEAGQHVFMLLDSITRLARGFNNAIRGGGGGKAMSGGLDSRALEAPRRLFAAARNTREAGSLTIMATALVETNNKGDDLIFQEFKGTGNMELVLDRKISQQYIYPAVDIFKSGTRREELLLPAHQLEKVHLIRRGLSGHRPVEAVERLLQVMGRYPNNNQMLIDIKARE